MTFKVKLHPIRHPAGEPFIGEEPSWESTTVPTQFDIVRALNWYSYCGDQKHYRKFLEEWVHATFEEGKERKKWLGLVESIPDRSMMSTIPSVARMMLQGCRLAPSMKYEIESFILANSTKGKVRGDASTSVRRPSVHDRMREQMLPLLYQVDDFVDACCLTTTKATIPTFTITPEMTAQHLGIVRRAILRYLDEFRIVAHARDTGDTGDDAEQLVEAYRYLPPRRLRMVITGLEDMMASLMPIQAKKKVARAPKPIDRKKLLAKVKYCKEYPALKLKSDGVMDLFECREVWVFDTKTRKIGVYTALPGGTMTVSGTTLKGFSPEESRQRTLRREEEQLAEFKKLRKTGLHKWFNNIRAKPLPLNGRLNAHIVILKVFT